MANASFGFSIPAKDSGHRRTAYLVRKDHQTPIRFSSQYSPDTLSRMSHRVERQVIILLDSMVVAQEFESRFEDSTFGILVRYTACRRSRDQ